MIMLMIFVPMFENQLDRVFLKFDFGSMCDGCIEFYFEVLFEFDVLV